MAEATTLKTKTVIAALLLLHLLVHPLIHAHWVVGSAPAETALREPGDNEGDRTRLAGPVHCMACRSGVNSVATPVASEFDPIPTFSAPLLVSSTVRPLSFFSTSLAARAPPLS